MGKTLAWEASLVVRSTNPENLNQSKQWKQEVGERSDLKGTSTSCLPQPLQVSRDFTEGVERISELEMWEEGWECCPVDMTWLLCSRILCGCGCQHRAAPRRSVTIQAGNTNQAQACLLDTKAKHLEATLKFNLWLFSKAGVNKNTVSVCWMRLSQAINTHKGTLRVLCPQWIQRRAYDYVLSMPQETESKIVNYERCLLLTSIAGKCTNIRAWIGILNHLVSQIYQVKVI